MPLAKISRRATPLGAFTFRELVEGRLRAARAVARGHDSAAALVERIDAELETRRLARFDRTERPDLP